MIKKFLKRYGLLAATAAITLASVLSSVVISATIHYLVLHISMTASAWFITLVCPILIAPLMSGYTLHLVLQLDKAHERLREVNNSDHLTSVYNRRYFMESLRAEIERSNRYGLPLSVAFIDVDDFKEINDRYGHLGGDEVLKRLAEACMKYVRQTDVFARIGGEEFAVLLPQTASEPARQLLERLRSCIAELRVPLPEEVVSVTVSVGLASAVGHVSEINGVLRKADEALYSAKRRGKNCVETNINIGELVPA